MMRICSDKAIIFAECTPKAKAFGVHSFMEMKLLDNASERERKLENNFFRGCTQQYQSYHFSTIST